MKLNNRRLMLTMLVGILFLSESMAFIYFKAKSDRFFKEVQKLENFRQDYDLIDGERQEFKKRYRDLAKEHENLMTQAKILLADRGQLRETEEALEKMIMERKALEDEKQKLGKSILDSNDELKKFQELESRTAQERDRYKEAFEKIKKDSAIGDLKREIAGLNKDKNRLEAVLRNKEKDIEKKDEEKIRLENKLQQVEFEGKDARKQIAEAIAKNKSLEQRVLSLPKKFAEIGRQNKMLLKETAQMHYNLGVFYTKNKLYDRAIAEFEKVVEIDPHHAYAHFNLGYIYVEYLVNRPKAMVEFRHYLTLAEEDDNDVDWVKKYLLTWETFDGNKPME